MHLIFEALEFIFETETLLLYLILIKATFPLPYLKKKKKSLTVLIFPWWQNLVIPIFNHEQLSHSKISLYLWNA